MSHYPAPGPRDRVFSLAPLACLCLIGVAWRAPFIPVVALHLFFLLSPFSPSSHILLHSRNSRPRRGITVVRDDPFQSLRFLHTVTHSLIWATARLTKGKENFIKKWEQPKKKLPGAITRRRTRGRKQRYLVHEPTGIIIVLSRTVFRSKQAEGTKTGDAYN